MEIIITPSIDLMDIDLNVSYNIYAITFYIFLPSQVGQYQQIIPLKRVFFADRSSVA